MQSQSYSFRPRHHDFSQVSARVLSSNKGGGDTNYSSHYRSCRLLDFLAAEQRVPAYLTCKQDLALSEQNTMNIRGSIRLTSNR